MNTQIHASIIKRNLKYALLFTVASSFALWGTTHVVQFGGALGFTYSPASFSAIVGDTVKWQGDFSVHPLSSTSVPATAAAWHNASGTVFQYVIQVPGTYHYRCDIHAGAGMTGSFTAAAMSIKNSRSFKQIEQGDMHAAIRIINFSEKSAQIIIPGPGRINSTALDLSGKIIHASYRE